MKRTVSTTPGAPAVPTPSQSLTTTGSLSPEKFRRDSLYTWYKRPQCSQCDEPYNLVPQSNRSGQLIRRPLILHCGHLACSSCIQNRQALQITCRQCKGVTTTSSKWYPRNGPPFPRTLYLYIGWLLFDSPIWSQFDDDFYMCGFLSHVNYVTNRKEPFGMKYKSKVKRDWAPKALACTPPVSPVTCYECLIVATDTMCSTCTVAFCAPCFKKVHVSRALKWHKLSTIDGNDGAGAVTLAEQQTVCRKHNGAELQHYCRSCNQAICAHCRRSGHMRHIVVLLKMEVSSGSDGRYR